MHTVRTFVVVPSLPKGLEGLKDIAHNVWWAWNADAIDLFRRLDLSLWDKTNHSPVKMLGQISQERLDQVSKDDGFIAHLGRVVGRMREYMGGPSWYHSRVNSHHDDSIAYFSAEFGLHESLPIYSGGLGILAGDHLKSASDLGLPLVGVGLLYRQGYFQQYLNADGWQQESYPDNDFYNMPVTLMTREDGRPIRFHIGIAGHDVVVQVWRIQVGRVPLYLLDTNLRCNRIEDRQITSHLYGGDNDMRIRQEILLGIGGLNALKALGINPKVCHMNEGHAAFLSLERSKQLMQEHDMSFDQACQATASGCVFTTHTPVPAGHDAFSPILMEKYFSEYYKDFGINWHDFMGIGKVNADDKTEPFSMTVLALRLSTARNGVSQLHGEVSREMCNNVWPGVPVNEVPITAITNGIHIQSWISQEMSGLLDRYLGPKWHDRPTDQAVFDRIDQIPDEELWRTHERRRERLVAFARRRLKSQLQNRGASPSALAVAEEVLDPEALTIGFARRFATYKRATLLFRDMERFAKIISDKDRPVQIIFAGKAHPRDTEGKELIRRVNHFVSEDTFRRRIVFLENYDMNVARYLIQGVDVWLNTPRRGMEASGTSGMKVLANGGLNLSVLDGWWCEGYSNNRTGWSIGQGETYTDSEYEDEVESNALYDLLEKQVVPAFYDRSADKLPRQWLTLMKNSMRELATQFSTSRMVAEYANGFYAPSARRWDKFSADNFGLSRTLADWKESIRDRWSEVSIGKIDMVEHDEVHVGEKLEIRCQVQLGNIDPSDVIVELYQGPVDAEGEIHDGATTEMKWMGPASDGFHIFSGNIPCVYSGLCGFLARVIPMHPDLPDKHSTGLICWDDDNAAGRHIKTTQELVV